MIKAIKRIVRRKDVVNGFKLYKKPLLVSYSRSGTNWIRYFVETISQKPTPGVKRLCDGDDYCMDRAHAGFSVMNNYKKVILVLRNYKECLLRHHGVDVLSRFKSISDFLGNTELGQPCNWYVENISAYEKFQGQKMVLYYEDIIARPNEALSDLGGFMDFETDSVKHFLTALESHKIKSLDGYEAVGHSSFTKGEQKSLHYHANRSLSSSQKKAFDDYYKKDYKELFDKYLKRYAE